MPKARSPSPNAQGKPKRPPNAWIIFRSEMNVSMRRDDPRATQADLSKRISDLWANASPYTKKMYEQKAEEAKLRHQALYPNYKFAPRKKEEIQREKQAKQEAKEARANRKNAKHASRNLPPASLPLYPTGDGLDPEGPTPPMSLAGSPVDYSSRETSPAHYSPQDSILAPSETFSSSVSAETPVAGPSTWPGSLSAPQPSDPWPDTEYNSMLQFQLPNTTGLSLDNWDNAMGITLLGTGDSNIFQLDPFDNGIIDGQQSLDLSINASGLDGMFGTTPWDFHQTMDQNQSSEDLQFDPNLNDIASLLAASAAAHPDPSYAPNLSFDMEASQNTFVSGSAESPGPSYDVNTSFINYSGSAVIPPSQTQTYEQAAAEHQANATSYVPPAGAAYASNRRVGGSWSQFSFQESVSPQSYAVSATAQ